LSAIGSVIGVLRVVDASDAGLVVGVDTHRDMHAVVLVDPVGRLIASETFPTTRSRAAGAHRVGAASRYDPEPIRHP
jgi:hypothetical protein